jgi:hypothetical protein
MRIVPVALGVLFLIGGIVLEAMYIANSKLSLFGTTFSQNTSLGAGVVSLILGFILLYAGVRIPKIQAVQH